MSDTDRPSGEGGPNGADIETLLDRLETLEAIVDDPDEREQVERTMRIARRLPGSGLVGRRIRKYTTRDMAETFVGGILLSLPMLVEDGVFEIAEWFLATTVAGVPVFLAGNVAFVVLLTIGLLYWADFREVRISRPIFGIVPRRLVGVLTISFLTSAFLLILWGRHRAGDPSSALEIFARISVLWSAAAIGGALGDILPGESKGYDVTIDNIDDIIRSD